MDHPGPGDRRAVITLASFNIHMGVDGWGRPFDLVGACRHLDADVLVLQESWTPDRGGPSSARIVADALGYRVVDEVTLAHGKRFGPLPSESDRWSPWPRHVRKAFRLDQEGWRSRTGRADRPVEEGRWGIAMLARVPVHRCEVVHLGQLRRDPARRSAIVAVTDLDGREVSLIGTHMSHITHGSHAQYRQLGRRLPHPDHAAVLAGDMNLWGPPVSSFFPAWRRAVIGRTWPAWRPHSQLDHILVTPPLSVVQARVADRSGSDHRPVVATLALS